MSYKAFNGNANMWISAIQLLLKKPFWNNHTVSSLLARYVTFKNFTVTGKRHAGRMRQQYLPVSTHIPSKHAQGLDQQQTAHFHRLPMYSANLGRQFVTYPNAFLSGPGFHPKRSACDVVRQIARDRNQCISHGVSATSDHCDRAESRIILTLGQEQTKIGRGEL